MASNPIGTIIGLCFGCIGGILSYMFCMSAYTLKHPLNTQEKLSVCVVATLCFYSLVCIVSAILSICNGYHVVGGSLGMVLCQSQGLLTHFIGGVCISLHLVLAVDRWSHTVYHVQLSRNTMIWIMVVPSFVFLVICCSALMFDDGFVASSSGLVCYIRPTSNSQNSMWPRVIAGLYCLVAVVLFQFNTVLYVRMVVLLRSIKKSLVGNETRGTEILQVLLWRCIMVLITFWVSWTGLLIVFAYTILSNTEVDPFLDTLALIPTSIEAIISPIVLMSMNQIFQEAFRDRYLFFLKAPVWEGPLDVRLSSKMDKKGVSVLPVHSTVKDASDWIPTEIS